MSQAEQRVVYTGKPEHVAAALALLQSHGLHPETRDTASMALPWVSSGSAQVGLVVPDGEVDQARHLLSELEHEHDTGASVRAARLGRPLLLSIALLVGGVLLVISQQEASGGLAVLGVLGVVCVVVGGIRFADLVRRGRRGADGD